jgi:methylmalonyl-CoA/ethylmalonyl-CoA epimerase
MIGDNSIYSKLHHICFITKDIDKAMAHYKSLGIGPFHAPPVKPAELTLRGKQIPVDYFKRAEVLGKMGSINLQLCQPISGESPWQEFLDAKGECVHHLGFIIDDVEKEVDQFKAAGFEVLLSSKFVGGGGAAYIDISKTGDFYIELIQPPPGVKD